MGTPSFDVDDSKLQPPRPRSGIVTRTALLDRLVASPELPVVAVTAPAGYGKTTLLAQWAQRRHPRATWLSVDERDNDPAVLLTYLRLALEQLGKPRKRPIRPTGSRGVGVGVADVAGLVSSTFAGQAPALVVLDNVELLRNVECRDMVAELAFRLPDGFQLAIGSRNDVPLPVPRLRAQGGLAEIGTRDLAMDEAEAHALLTGAGVESVETTRTLVEQTEGWAAALYLAALDDQRRERPPRGW